MAEFSIDDKDLVGLEGKVVIVTGGSNGIGLAMVELFLSLGALVVNGDLEADRGRQAHPNYQFFRTDVSSWADLVALFKQPEAVFGRPVDHVVANAGVGPLADYLSTEVDAAGDPKEPSHATLDVNLKGVTNTVTLAIFHLRRRPGGGSIVINSSSTGLQRFRAVDYSKCLPALDAPRPGLVLPRWANHASSRARRCQTRGRRPRPGAKTAPPERRAADPHQHAGAELDRK